MATGSLKQNTPVGTRGQLQQVAHHPVAGHVAIVVAVGLRHRVQRRHFDAVLLQGLAVPFATAHRGADVLAADVGNEPAAAFDQVPRGQHAHRFIVHADEVRRQPFELAVKQHVGNALFFDATEGFDPALRGGDNQCVHAAGQHLVHLVAFEFGILFRTGDDQSIAVLAQHRRQAFGHLREEGMHEIGDHQADNVAATGYQRAGGEVGTVVQFLHSASALVRASPH